MRKEQKVSRFSMQELFVGFAPAKQPRYLLLLAVEQEDLLPRPNEKGTGLAALETMGKELLSVFVKSQSPDQLPEKPPEQSKENLRQFFISKRLNFQKTPGKVNEPVPVMPQMRGLSLRKGLQQIDTYKMKVRINGSGRIIAQYPLPGQSLLGVDECILTLELK
jgi:cell division protein FtsI (penicillin-binding protein 3)